MLKVLIPLFLLLLLSTQGVSAFDYFNYIGTWDKKPSVCIEFDPTSKKYKYEVISGVLDWKKEFKKYFGNDNFDYEVRIDKGDTCDIFIFFDTSEKRRDIYHYRASGYTLCEIWGEYKITECKIEIFFEYTEEKYIRSTVSHELAHAFGLGHREVSEGKQLPWLVEEKDIMIWQAAPYQKITKASLRAFEEIYGDDGWGGHNYKYLSKFYPPHH